MSKVFIQFHQEHSSSRQMVIISKGVTSHLVACQADGTIPLENDLFEYSHNLCIFKIMISLSPSGIFYLCWSTLEKTVHTADPERENSLWHS